MLSPILQILRGGLLDPLVRPVYGRYADRRRLRADMSRRRQRLTTSENARSRDRSLRWARPQPCQRSRRLLPACAPEGESLQSCPWTRERSETGEPALSEVKGNLLLRPLSVVQREGHDFQSCRSAAIKNRALAPEVGFLRASSALLQPPVPGRRQRPTSPICRNHKSRAKIA